MGGILYKAAKACRDKYCSLVPNKTSWENLTRKQREVDVACLQAAADVLASGEVVYLKEVDAGTDNACWVVCAKVDPGAVPFAPAV